MTYGTSIYQIHTFQHKMLGWVSISNAFTIEGNLMLNKLTNFNDVKDITTEEYFSGDKYATDVFNTKYTKLLDERGKIVDQTCGAAVRHETPAEVFWRVAYGLASMEEHKEHGDRLSKVWFSLMWDGWFRPGGSVLSGVGEVKKVSLLNCTTVPLGGDSLEDIAKCDYDLMKVAASRQGVGFDASRLRPNKAPVNNAASESTGVVPWVDKLVSIGKYVGQSGRLPAVLCSLKVSHPDVEEFIVAKTDLGKIESANLSIQVSNDFMEAVKSDSDWELRFEFENNQYKPIVKIVKAVDLFELISKTAHACAEPGIQYIDLMRDGSMVHRIYEETGDSRYKLISSNACSEKILPAYGVCNLLSLNMEKFSTDVDECKKQLNEIVPHLVALSDNVVSYELHHNKSPLPAQKWILEQTREIGLGVTNVHGWLLKKDLAYDSSEAINDVELFFKHYAYNVFKCSMELGKIKGSAPAYDKVKNKSAYMRSTYFKHIVDEFFGGDYKKISHMRNMSHMSIAPAGSISSVFPDPCISAGVEPIIGAFYWRRTRAVTKGVYTHYFVIPSKIKNYLLSKIDKNTEDYTKLKNFSGSEPDEDGKIGIELVTIIEKYLPKGFFKPAHAIDPLQKIKLMSAIYNWVDACISCTYNLPSDATIDTVKNIYTEAYNYGVRAVSIYVEGCRQGILIFEDPVTNKAKFENSNHQLLCDAGERPKSIVHMCAPKRPTTLPCNVHHCSVKGVPWLVLVGMMDDAPYEIFAGRVDDGLYVPKTCKSGNIVKTPRNKYSLEVRIRNSDVEYKDIAHILMDSEQRAVTRLLSLAMRHGTPLEFIQNQLKKVNGDITEFSTVVARVLGTYIKQYLFIKDSNKCPVCGEDSIIREGGCIKCINCSYSRCE